ELRPVRGRADERHLGLIRGPRRVAAADGVVAPLRVVERLDLRAGEVGDEQPGDPAPRGTREHDLAPGHVKGRLAVTAGATGDAVDPVPAPRRLPVYGEGVAVRHERDVGTALRGERW